MRYNHFDMLPIHAFRQVGGRMTLEGGGGGGGDGGAGQREAERQARIRAATDTINNIFNQSGRNNLYSSHKTAVYDLNSQETNRQAAEAERVNRFGLARTGLLGGSADIDSNAELNRRTNEGLIRSGGIADQAAADLQAQDERTRANLISMAQSGIDTGSAASMALNGLSANANQAASARSGATVGGLFDDLSQAYLTNQILTGRNAALSGMDKDQFIGSQSTSGGTQGTVTKG